MTKEKKSRKRARSVQTEEKKEVLPPATRSSDEAPPKKLKWTNKQRVLVFSSRGINHRHRHLMQDLKRLMPHSKNEPKMERTKQLQVVNDMCVMKNCNHAMMFEGRKKRDLYLWLSNVANGPSIKFAVQNIHTMGELKLTGNCLTTSRPLLSFDENFTTQPHYALMKEVFVQIFGIPNHHPKSQPFFDHVYSFSIQDNRIWFRNFQILSEDGALAEVGPRFVLNPVKIFSGSFGGSAIWQNDSYVTPTQTRVAIKKAASTHYVNRIQQKVKRKLTRPKTSYDLNPLDDIFAQNDPLDAALQLKKAVNVKEKVKKRTSKKVK